MKNLLTSVLRLYLRGQQQQEEDTGPDWPPVASTHPSRVCSRLELRNKEKQTNIRSDPMRSSCHHSAARGQTHWARSHQSPVYLPELGAPGRSAVRVKAEPITSLPVCTFHSKSASVNTFCDVHSSSAKNNTHSHLHLRAVYKPQLTP